jgi:pilus assembly protein Flp/PilA
MLRKLLRKQEGATAVEYGLIVALMALAALVAIQSLADETDGMWSKVRSEVTTAAP